VVVLGVLVSRLRVPRAPTAESPLEVLQRRYAEGALTTVEYEERRQKLADAGAAAH
jgi:uncharacterized membrane protein